VKSEEGLFAVAFVVFELEIVVDYGGFAFPKNQLKKVEDGSFIGNGDADPSSRFKDAMKFANEFDRVEVEMLHRFPAENRVEMIIGKIKLMGGGFSRAE